MDNTLCFLLSQAQFYKTYQFLGGRKQNHLVLLFWIQMQHRLHCYQTSALKVIEVGLTDFHRSLPSSPPSEMHCQEIPRCSSWEW